MRNASQAHYDVIKKRFDKDFDIGSLAMQTASTIDGKKTKKNLENFARLTSKKIPKVIFRTFDRSRSASGWDASAHRDVALKALYVEHREDGEHHSERRLVVAKTVQRDQCANNDTQDRRFLNSVAVLILAN